EFKNKSSEGLHEELLAFKFQYFHPNLLGLFRVIIFRLSTSRHSHFYGDGEYTNQIPQITLRDGRIVNKTIGIEHAFMTIFNRIKPQIYETGDPRFLNRNTLRNFNQYSKNAAARALNHLLMEVDLNGDVGTYFEMRIKINQEFHNWVQLSKERYL
ncbi:hypothetical protein L9F63_023439, partial [Diploptera punctata]